MPSLRLTQSQTICFAAVSIGSLRMALIPPFQPLFPTGIQERVIPNLRIGRFPWSYQAALLQDAPRATLLWLKPRFIFSCAAIRESRFVLHPTPGGPVPSRGSDRNPCDRFRSNETWAFTRIEVRPLGRRALRAEMVCTLRVALRRPAG